VNKKERFAALCRNVKGSKKTVHAQDANGQQSDYSATNIAAVDDNGFYMRDISAPVLFENFVIMWYT
jgi:hypothetical protein